MYSYNQYRNSAGRGIMGSSAESILSPYGIALARSAGGGGLAMLGAAAGCHSSVEEDLELEASEFHSLDGGSGGGWLSDLELESDALELSPHQPDLHRKQVSHGDLDGGISQPRHITSAVAITFSSMQATGIAQPSGELLSFAGLLASTVLPAPQQDRAAILKPAHGLSQPQIHLLQPQPLLQPEALLLSVGTRLPSSCKLADERQSDPASTTVTAGAGDPGFAALDKLSCITCRLVTKFVSSHTDEAPVASPRPCPPVPVQEPAAVPLADTSSHALSLDGLQAAAHSASIEEVLQCIDTSAASSSPEVAEAPQQPTLLQPSHSVTLEVDVQGLHLLSCSPSSSKWDQTARSAAACVQRWDEATGAATAAAATAAAIASTNTSHKNGESCWYEIQVASTAEMKRCALAANC